MRLLSAILLLFLASTTVAQEVPVIGQYLFNEMVLNPAATGHQEALTGQLSYRKQWMGVDGAPSTQNISVQTPLNDGKMGVGVLFYRDELGVSSESGLMLNYAYRLKIKSDQTLSFGIGTGLFFQRARYSQLALNDIGDNSFLSDSPLGVSPNFSAGLRYEFDRLELGLSVPLLLTSKYYTSSSSWKLENDFSNYNLLVRSVYSYPLMNQFSIKIGGLFKYHTHMGSQMDLTLVGEIKSSVQAGVGYRSREGILVMSRVGINKRWDVGLQYEIPTSKLYQYRSGSLEISLIYQSLFETKAASPRNL